jgi:hypothetical protein
MPSYAPFTSSGSRAFQKNSVPELTKAYAYRCMHYSGIAKGSYLGCSTAGICWSLVIQAMGTLFNAANRIKTVCRCISQPLPNCSNHLSWKHFFSRSKCLGLRSNERDDICSPTGRSMSRAPLFPSIPDAGYRFLSVTCRRSLPFSLLSKFSPRHDLVLL